MTFIRQGGKATLRHPHGGQDGTRCWFPCQWPGKENEVCSVPCRPQGQPKRYENDWEYTGSLDEPTLTPSINCCHDQCWHGYVRNGVMVK